MRKCDKKREHDAIDDALENMGIKVKDLYFLVKEKHQIQISYATFRNYISGFGGKFGFKDIQWISEELKMPIAVLNECLVSRRERIQQRHRKTKVVDKEAHKGKFEWGTDKQSDPALTYEELADRCVKLEKELAELTIKYARKSKSCEVAYNEVFQCPLADHCTNYGKELPLVTPDEQLKAYKDCFTWGVKEYSEKLIEYIADSSPLHMVYGKLSLNDFQSFEKMLHGMTDQRYYGNYHEDLFMGLVIAFIRTAAEDIIIHEGYNMEVGQNEKEV